MITAATYVPIVPNGYTRFIEPITKHEDDVALTFLSDVTKAITTRHTYDALIVTEETLSLLGACMDRMLTEHTFDPDSYRAAKMLINSTAPMPPSSI